MIDSSKRYLVTGGTGFLGRALLRRLSFEGVNNIVVVARNEGRLTSLKTEFPSINIIQGDISDPIICAKTVRNISGIFHLAAFKQVRSAETQAYQCIQSNIIGTVRLLSESVQMGGTGSLDFFTYISTDKAAQLRGVYGASKFLGEKLMAEFEQINPSTRYITIRLGNIFGSTGSFIYRWRNLLQSGKDIVITDPTATRFFLPVDSAVDIIIDHIRAKSGTKPKYPQFKAATMETALKACQNLWGDQSKIKIVGLQDGENKHETLDGVTFSNQAPQYTQDELIKLLLAMPIAHEDLV